MSDDEHSSAYASDSERDSSEYSSSYDDEEEEDGVIHRVTNLYAQRYLDEQSEEDASYSPPDSESSESEYSE